MSCLARARHFIGTRLFFKKHATSKNCSQVIEPHSGTFKFLESTIQIRPTRTVSQFYLKNYDSAQRAVVRKFLHTQHWDSFNNSNLKSALITGTLCRIARYTTPPVCDLHTAGPPTQGLDLLSPVVMMMMMNVIYNYIVKAAAGCIPGGNNYSSQTARAR